MLLTRFNLPSHGHESLIREQENWLRNRVALFERYCLPSVAAQTCRDFSWIIYFDPQSPRWLREWIADHERQGHFWAIFRAEVPRTDLIGDIRTVVDEPHGAEPRTTTAEPRTTTAELLTTNLDNDDSIAVDFVARLQAVERVGERSAVYLADGVICRGDRLYRRVDRYNAFCSVRETWAQPITCWATWHNLLRDLMPTVVLRGTPGWLQVVHGANVSNRVRGRLTGVARHRAAFPGLLDALPEPTVTRRARDALVAVSVRTLREGGRAAAKAALTRVAGKRGIDRVKLLLARARHPTAWYRR